MKLRKTLEGHEGPVTCCRVDNDGRRVATGSRDKTVAVWSLRSGKRERVFEGHRGGVSVLAFGPGGELISGDTRGGIRVWSWPKGKVLLELNEHVGTVYTLGCSADGSLLASGAKDGSICVWSLESGDLVHRYEVGPRGQSFVFAGDGAHLVSASGGNTFSFWSLETGELAWEQAAGPGTVGALELDRSGEWVVSRGWRGPVTIWSASSWGYTAVLPIVEKGLSGANLRPGWEQLVCAHDGGVGLFDSENGELLDSHELPKGAVDLDVAPGGERLVAASGKAGYVLDFED